MCGISAAIIRSQNHRYWDLLKASEIRGQDGTGYAIFGPEENFFVHKTPFKASLLASFPSLIPGNVVVGQNRLAVFGLDHTNDQPLLSGTHLALVHNGNLYDFEKVFLEERLPRALEVDTELILRRIERARRDTSLAFSGSLTESIYQQMISRALRNLKGNWACLMYDSEYKYLSAFVYEKPLFMTEFEGNTYFFSTERIGKKVFGGGAGIIEIPHNTIRVFPA